MSPNNKCEVSLQKISSSEYYDPDKTWRHGPRHGMYPPIHSSQLKTQVISKYTFLTLLTYISTLCQINLQNQSLHKHKTYIHKHQTQIFKELVPSILPLLKEHIRLGHAGLSRITTTESGNINCLLQIISAADHHLKT